MKVIKSTSTEIVVSIRQFESNDNATFTFPVAGEAEDLAPLFSGPLWSAIIWERSVKTICNFMERNPKTFYGKDVVELGCGLGIPGLVASITCGAKNTWLTDRGEDLQPLVKAMEVNADVLQSIRGKVTTIDYDWSEKPRGDVRAEAIIAVECISADVYGKESLEWLVSAIKVVARADRDVDLYLCSARRKNDGLDFVLERVSEQCAIGVNGVERLTGYAEEENTDVELYRVVLRRKQ